MRFAGLLRPVRALREAVAFYCQGLGFVAEPGDGNGRPPRWPEGLWREPPRGSALLRLGAQQLELVECVDAAEPWPDSSSGDPRFQHIAVIAGDMAAACARLWAQAPRLQAITRDGPQRLAGAAAGITAFKFRDLDGHPVELLAFDAGRMPPQWQAAQSAQAGEPTLATLGIDHSALCVADTDRALRCYRDALGLAVDGAQVNRGPAQARLDGLPEATVDVVSLRPAASTPHLELLGYHGLPPLPTLPAAATGGWADHTVLQVDDLAAITERWRRVLPAAAAPERLAPRDAGIAACARALDPDGHALLLVQRR